MTTLNRTTLIAVVAGLLATSLTSNPAWAVVSYTVTDLGTVGGTASTAADINASGQVVGEAYTTDNVWHAFLYSDSDSTMTDLNSPIAPLSGWTLATADCINDLGQIVGHGTINGQMHAFLLTPVPVSVPTVTTTAPVALGTTTANSGGKVM